MGALDGITHISAALRLCARGTYAQQATQAGAGLGLLGATVRAGSHSVQTMTSHMFAPRVTRLCSLVRLISQKKYSIDRKPCRRNTHLAKDARYEGISGFGGRTRTEDPWFLSIDKDAEEVTVVETSDPVSGSLCT